MRLAEIESLVGIPYDEDDFDCADFVAHVQKELFSREIVMPGRRPRGVEGQAKLGELSAKYAVKTVSPVDGDLVLMREHGCNRAGHVGVYFWLDHESWVIHSNHKNGCSVLHRARDLPNFCLHIEGLYKWL